MNRPLQTDIVVIHPVTKYKNGRPGWSDIERKTYKVPAKKLSPTPMLVLAYREGEFEKSGVPADIIEITDSAGPTRLF